MRQSSAPRNPALANPTLAVGALTLVASACATSSPTFEPCPGFTIDGAFTDDRADGERCTEWTVEPVRGRFGDLYVDVSPDGDLMVLNDWHLRDDAPAEPEMYNLFCLATSLGMFEIRVFGDHHVEAWRDGEPYDEIEGAAGFGPSPLTATPHTIFEFRLATLPTRVVMSECDPAGGPMGFPAAPPDVTVAPSGSCFPGSAPEIPHNLVREPNVFDIALSPSGVAYSRILEGAALIGASRYEVAQDERLVLHGSSFGDIPGEVLFSSTPAVVTGWTDAEVTVVVPAVTGPIDLWLAPPDAAASNAIRVRVTEADAPARLPRLDRPGVPVRSPDRTLCIPRCGECGDDGCGGSCGECPEGSECTEDHTCFELD
ncbi:MAG: hypothetical protein AB7S26_03305 [Sandaracinaceae bacterium]